MRKSALCFSVAIALLLSACATNPAARRQSIKNAPLISQVKLGQTMAEVTAIMGHAGEWTESAMAGGVERVSWGYITDYEADMGTLVIFERGKVVEIKNTPWVGQGKYR